MVSSVGALPVNRDGGRFRHIFYIMMENHATDEIFGNTVDAPTSTGWQVATPFQPIILG